MSDRGRSRALRAALLVFVAGAGIAWMAGRLQGASNDRREARVFADRVTHYADELRGRLERYEYGVRGARGAVVAAGGEAITRERFVDYVKTREMAREFPGARGFGFIRRVSAVEVPGFLARARSEGRPDFEIRGLSRNDGERFVIQYIEPEADNRQAVGLDIASSPERRAAAVTAMASGSAQLTPPITLAQAGGHPHGGFLLLLPVFRPGAETGDQASRESAAIGWAYAPLVIDEVLSGLEPHDGGIAVRLSDVSDAGLPAFYDSHPEAADTSFGPAAVRELAIWGRRWRLEARALPAFRAGVAGTSPSLVMGALLTAAGLLGGLAFLAMRGRERRTEVLAEKDGLLRGIVDAMPQAILVVDEQGAILQANKQVTEIFGYWGSELIGRSVDELLPDADRVAHASQRRGYDHRTRKMGARRDLHARHRTGRLFPVEISLSSLDAGRRRVAVAGVLDVSEQHATLERLRAGEALWRELANSMPQLVWTCDADGACNFLSARWVEYTGIAEERQLGDRWLEQVHPDDRAALSEEWRKAVEGRRTFHVEFRIRRHDGGYRWFDTQALPVLDAQGKVRRWIGANTDIEGRRQAEEDLRLLNATLETRVAERTSMLAGARRDLENILDTMPSMVGYWDRDQLNRFANHAYKDWFGVDPAKLPGTPIRDLLGPEIYEKNRAYIEGALAGVPQQFEREVGGRHSMARYLPDVVEGEVRGFYAFVTDVTDLKVAMRAAEAASAAKSAFLANMSHEIRTPMNAVMNLAYLMEQGELTFEQRDLLAKMKIASRSLLGLINDILDLSKIEAGQMDLATETFSLHARIDETVQVMSAQAAAKRLDLSVDTSPDLPAYVRGDSLRLQQVLTNLIGNAIKFTDTGSVRLGVRQEAVEEDRVCLRFTVADTGIGIAPEMQSSLFEPFMQADASSMRRFGGSGLGLAISKRLVTLMGGEIGFESRPGSGSTFWFTVWLRPEREATLVTASPQALEALIADDSEDQRAALAATARALGWRVETVASGEEAIERVDDRIRGGRPYDTLLIDWRMPGLDGLQTLAEVRRRHAESAAPAVILVTAYDRAELERAPDVKLADAVLPKPVDPSTLFNAVHEAVARRSGSAARVTSGAQPREPGELSLHGVRVLLVDDSVINLEVGQKILEREGAQVELATHGRMAVELLRASPAGYDVVLMDVQMPVLDGHAATRAIRHELGLHDLPIIALTAGALLSERQRAFDAGMNEFISKPFDAEQMIAAVAHLAGRSAGTRMAISAVAAPQIAGLDIRAVGGRLGDDWPLLRRLLRSLFGEFAGAWPPLRGDGDREVLSRRAHKLKGVAGNVGADRLRELAQEAEAAALAGDSVLLAGCGERIVAEIARLRVAASAFLDEPAPGPLTRVGAEPDETPGDGALDELERLLRRQDLAAIDRHAAMAAGLERLLGPERHRRLESAIHQLRFDEALAVLRMPQATNPEAPTGAER